MRVYATQDVRAPSWRVFCRASYRDGARALAKEPPGVAI